MGARFSQELKFDFADGATVSNVKFAGGGGFAGVLIVPAGLNGKTVQFVATSPDGLYADADLLASAKTLATGPNVLSAAEMALVAAVANLKLKLNSAVSGAQSCVLLWKS